MYGGTEAGGRSWLAKHVCVGVVVFSFLPLTHDVPGPVCRLVPSQVVHRGKDGDAVSSLAHHPSLPLLATAGADGVVKLFTQ